MAETTQETGVNMLADALPAQIKRVQEKRERWAEYQRMCPGADFRLGMAMMQSEIDEGIAALASGDVARMIRAHEDLAANSDDD